MFWSDGFFPLNFKRILVITEYELMEKAFKIPALCARGLTNEAFEAYNFDNDVYGIDKLAANKGYTKKGTDPGIAMGEYNSSHKLLRQKWHQTVMKMMSRNELDKMIGQDRNRTY